MRAKNSSRLNSKLSANFVNGWGGDERRLWIQKSSACGKKRLKEVDCEIDTLISMYNL